MEPCTQVRFLHDYFHDTSTYDMPITTIVHAWAHWPIAGIMTQTEDQCMIRRSLSTGQSRAMILHQEEPTWTSLRHKQPGLQSV